MLAGLAEDGDHAHALTVAQASVEKPRVVCGPRVAFKEGCKMLLRRCEQHTLSCRPA